MNGITLPHDIKQYIRRKAIVYLVKLFLGYVAVVVVNIAIWNYFTNPVTHVIVIVAPYSCPSCSLAFPRIFFTVPWLERLHPYILQRRPAPIGRACGIGPTRST